MENLLLVFRPIVFNVTTLGLYHKEIDTYDVLLFVFRPFIRKVTSSTILTYTKYNSKNNLTKFIINNICNFTTYAITNEITTKDFTIKFISNLVSCYIVNTKYRDNNNLVLTISKFISLKIFDVMINILHLLIILI